MVILCANASLPPSPASLFRRRDMVAGAFVNAILLSDSGISSAGETNEDGGEDSDDEETPSPIETSSTSQNNLFFLLPALSKVLNEKSDHNDLVSSKLATSEQCVKTFTKFLTGATQRKPLVIAEVAWAVDVLEGCARHLKDAARNRIGNEMGNLLGARGGEGGGHSGLI